MQGPGAAECDEREIARVVSALDGDDAQRTKHLRVHDLDHGRGIDVSERGRRGVAVEDEPARQLRRQAPEQEVRVGDCRPAAGAVAGGAWMRARALGADLHRAARIDAHERAPARADRVQVDGGEPNREAADVAPGDARGAAAGKEAHVCRRPAHVERDRVAETGAPRDEPRAADARRGAGDEYRRRMSRGLRQRRNAARGEHHERIREAGRTRGVGERPQVPRRDRSEVRIRGDG